MVVAKIDLTCGTGKNYLAEYDAATEENKRKMLAI